MRALSEGAYRYRPLKQGLDGWDVYALQTGLDITADGAFGPITKKAVEDFQRDQKLTADGIAGTVTQREIALQILWPLQRQHRTPPGLLRGLVEGESAFILGNHTPPYANGNRDFGVCQRNGAEAENFMRLAFHVGQSITMLAADPERGMRVRKDRYTERLRSRNFDGRTPFGQMPLDEYAWFLAVASWNAPSWADHLSKGGSLTATQTAHVKKYVESKIVYVTSWPA
jgi:hypothetical protein